MLHNRIINPIKMPDLCFSPLDTIYTLNIEVLVIVVYWNSQIISL